MGLGLKSFKGGVQSAWRDTAACAIRKFRADGDAVRVIAESENRKKDELFEFTEIHRNGVVTSLQFKWKWKVLVQPLSKEGIADCRSSKLALSAGGS